MKKKETVEDFLARGGIIKVIPKQEVPETSNLLRIESTPENRIMSLDDGAHYFAENRKSNKTPKSVSLKDIVDNFNLPKEVVNRLRGVNESR